ncbi:hypothetical protein COU20_02150 [Candidatus Kaiserbacteria bacterium CG10_big_fil_rev_8_21_14_0_10_59_10]|uniref:DHFR domain-containing protein n=1 Tax=Candidatus Kaiserbacteria bacterium CG10_big_fil_rev_8_21_14_0_10_59_10 TaxID=1974612 RepID=A0A2H0U7U6_9BACT|nr:MAG: hypothetical protein COU20_02150 [Candidatus Kaiserbacteria bacterium CG10_big_fil_rev_8_21_14_0_10_59_10]
MARTRYIAIAAVTLDGRIAAHERHLTDWTSREDKRLLREVLDSADVVLVGRKTYELARTRLERRGRNCIVLTRSAAGVRRVHERLAFLNPKKENVRAFIRRHGYRRVVILGGTETYTYCRDAGMLDELYLTIEPVLFGKGLPLLAGKLFVQKGRNVEVKKLNKKGSTLVHVRSFAPLGRTV